jgi:predicted transcriptional regulator YheO
MVANKSSENSDPDLGTYSKKSTGRELSVQEETDIRLKTLVELLHDKGIINKKELESRVAMHLHEISKATAFEEMDEEL